MDIDLIKKNYSERSLEGLRTLLNELETLREDAVDALKDEFIARNDTDSIQRIEAFKNTGKEQRFSNEEAKEYIRTELANGQSLQVIRLELIERGINIFDIVNEDENLETEAIEYMTNLKEQGVKDNNELMEHINDRFVVVEGKEAELLTSLKRNGTLNILFGILLIIIGCVLLIGHIYLRRLPITSLVLIVLGIWRLSRGIKQRS